MINVLIVARLPIIREGLKGILASEPDFNTSTQTRFESGELVEGILANQADVVLVDVEVLEQEGWDLLRELSVVAPDIATLVMSDNAQDRRVVDAFDLGAHGYITRDAAPAEMAAAIRAVRQGLYVLHPIAARQLIVGPRPEDALSPDDESLIESSSERRRHELIEPLSARELDVLRLIVRGMANKQIAAELVITEHTVKFHIRAILSKLGAANRTEAVTLALQKGLISL